MLSLNILSVAALSLSVAQAHTNLGNLRLT